MGEIYDFFAGKDKTPMQKWKEAQLIKEQLKRLKKEERLIKSTLLKSKNTLKQVPDKQLAKVLRPEYLEEELKDKAHEVKALKQRLHDTPKKYRGSKPPKPEEGDYQQAA